MKIVFLGNLSPLPYYLELEVDKSRISRITSWNESLVLELSKIDNIEIYVFTIYKHGQTRKIKNGNINITYLNVSKYLNGMTLFFATVLKVLKEIKKINPDIVHGVGTEHLWPFISILSGKKNVITIHGIVSEIIKNTSIPLLSRLRYFGVLEKYVLKKVKNIILVSPYVNQFVSNSKSLNLFNIPNPVPQEYFNIETNPGENFKICFIGNTGFGKGLKILINAFMSIQDEIDISKWSVKIIGNLVEGEYFDQCKKLISENNLKDKFEFTGFLLKDELLLQFSNSAFLVHPSLQETAPMSISEAMAVGIPVIASQVGGIPYMISNNVTGLLFPTGNEEILKNKMLSLMTDSELRRKIGANAKEYAKKNWTSSEIATKTFNAYKEIVFSIK